MPPNDNYCDIANFSLKELQQIGWSGKMNQSKSQDSWASYSEGYDPDEDGAYESFDRRVLWRNRTSDFPNLEVGMTMSMLSMDGDCRKQLCQLER